MVFIVPAASRGLAGPSDPIASLRREAQCRQRPERQRGRSSVLHRRKGDEEGRLTFLQRDVRQPAGGLFFFRGQFLYLRQFAVGLFFFRRRKKNQERRHPFEWVDDDLGALPPRPPPPINGRPSHSRLLPALPCRPGETSFGGGGKAVPFLCRLVNLILHSCRYGKTCTPGPQGGPGRSR